MRYKAEPCRTCVHARTVRRVPERYACDAPAVIAAGEDARNSTAVEVGAELSGTPRLQKKIGVKFVRVGMAGALLWPVSYSVENVALCKTYTAAK